MKYIQALLIVLIAGGATVAGGVIHGQLTYRWGSPTELLEAAKRLDRIPSDVGHWHMESAEELDQTSRDMLRCAASVNRRYRNRQTGDEVTVILLLGPAGPTAAHTPEICYPAYAYRERQQRKAISFAGPAAQGDVLWNVNFLASDYRGGSVSVYYGWSVGREWQAPVSSRFAFAGLPYLYKIQAATKLPAGQTPGETDACHDFLNQFLPAIRELLVASATHY